MRCLVFGFYDRANLGDEAYKIALPEIFGRNAVLEFKCTDDVSATMNVTAYDAVICGGGDIINAYFIEKIRSIKSCECNENIPFYAVSVGIPFDDNNMFLSIFDHVFVRSMNDYRLATKIIGDANVTYTPDAVFAIKPCTKKHTGGHSYNIAVCMATPVFVNDTDDVILRQYANYLTKIVSSRSTSYPNCMTIVNLLPFNTSANIQENDAALNVKLAKILAEKNTNVINHTIDELKNPVYMLNIFARMDFCICMRYHSAVFAIIAGKPFTCNFISQKLGNLLKDIESPERSHYRIPHDSTYHATCIDAEIAFSAASLAMKECVLKRPRVNKSDINRIIESLKIRRATIPNIILVRKMYKWISRHQIKIGSDISGMANMSGKECDSIARIISYAATGNLSSRYIWGLADRIRNDPDHDIMKSFEWIRNDIIIQERDNFETQKESAHKLICGPSDDLCGYHRSGWNYALKAFDFSKSGCVLLDNYVDRTFTWAHDTLIASGDIPYRVSWVGFIHHTFTVKNCDNNLIEVFKNVTFLESLKTCRHLFALSKHLAIQIREALVVAGFSEIGVTDLVHPTETPDNLFTIGHFQNNPHKKVVQIGAWLRNPFAIYDLPLYHSDELQKAVLKGKDMNLYFPPAEYMTRFESQELGDNTQYAPCRGSCRTHSGNVFVSGLIESIQGKIVSVQVIDKLSNEEYDTMLSENIVFIELIDCSAVNTVIECIVRNTPLFVNRLPALEEVLGRDYPGFYTDYLHAAKLMTNHDYIHNTTQYLSRLNKTPFKLETFERTFFESLHLHVPFAAASTEGRSMKHTDRPVPGVNDGQKRECEAGVRPRR